MQHIEISETLNIVTLILDDDPNILDLIEHALRKAGITKYKVFGSDAALLNELSDNMHILVIDHFLSSDMTGLDVMKVVIQKNPNVFVIAMSGTEDPHIVVDYVNAGVNRFVLKNDDNYLDQLLEFIKQGIEQFLKDLYFFRRQEALLNT